jgi:heme exporter protein CcmD
VATPPDLPSNVVDLWYHYEEVAMHFNQLIIEYRLRLMGGVGAVGAVSSYLIGGTVKDPMRRNWLRALVSSGLLVLFVAAACLDLFYYNALLEGAVDALLDFEAKHPPLNMSTSIANRVAYRGLIPIWTAYGLIFVCLASFTIWSWVRYRRERATIHRRDHE